MIYVGFGVLYLLTVAGFIWALRAQSRQFIDAWAESQARESAERHVLMERIQRPEYQPPPSNVIPINSPYVNPEPAEGKEPDDELRLVGTIDSMNGDEPAS